MFIPKSSTSLAVLTPISAYKSFTLLFSSYEQFISPFTLVPSTLLIFTFWKDFALSLTPPTLIKCSIPISLMCLTINPTSSI